MTAALEIQGRGRTAFCRLVSSRGLGSPPAGPYGGLGRLRTLPVSETLSRVLRLVSSSALDPYHPMNDIRTLCVRAF